MKKEVKLGILLIILSILAVTLSFGIIGDNIGCGGDSTSSKGEHTKETSSKFFNPSTLNNPSFEDNYTTNAQGNNIPTGWYVYIDPQTTANVHIDSSTRSPLHDTNGQSLKIEVTNVTLQQGPLTRNIGGVQVFQPILGAVPEKVYEVSFDAKESNFESSLKLNVYFERKLLNSTDGWESIGSAFYEYHSKKTINWETISLKAVTPYPCTPEEIQKYGCQNDDYQIRMFVIAHIQSNNFAPGGSAWIDNFNVNILNDGDELVPYKWADLIYPQNTEYVSDDILSWISFESRFVSTATDYEATLVNLIFDIPNSLNLILAYRKSTPPDFDLSAYLAGPTPGRESTHERYIFPKTISNMDFGYFTLFVKGEKSFYNLCKSLNINRVECKLYYHLEWNSLEDNTAIDSSVEKELPILAIKVKKAPKFSRLKYSIEALNWTLGTVSELLNTIEHIGTSNYSIDLGQVYQFNYAEPNLGACLDTNQHYNYPTFYPNIHDNILSATQNNLSSYNISNFWLHGAGIFKEKLYLPDPSCIAFKTDPSYLAIHDDGSTRDSLDPALEFNLLDGEQINNIASKIAQYNIKEGWFDFEAYHECFSQRCINYFHNKFPNHINSDPKIFYPFYPWPGTEQANFNMVEKRDMDWDATLAEIGTNRWKHLKEELSNSLGANGPFVLSNWRFTPGNQFNNLNHFDKAYSEGAIDAAMPVLYSSYKFLNEPGFAGKMLQNYLIGVYAMSNPNNLVENDSFEDGFGNSPVHFTFYDPSGSIQWIQIPTVSKSVPDNQAFEKYRSLMFTAPTTSYAQYSLSNIHPYSKYLFSVNTRFSGSHITPCISVEWIDDKGNAISQSEQCGYFDIEPWGRVSLLDEAPQNAKSTLIKLFVNGDNGKAWFDKLHAATFHLNGGFSFEDISLNDKMIEQYGSIKDFEITTYVSRIGEKSLKIVPQYGKTGAGVEQQVTTIVPNVYYQFNAHIYNNDRNSMCDLNAIWLDDQDNILKNDTYSKGVNTKANWKNNEFNRLVFSSSSPANATKVKFRAGCTQKKGKPFYIDDLGVYRDGPYLMPWISPGYEKLLDVTNENFLHLLKEVFVAGAHGFGLWPFTGLNGMKLNALSTIATMMNTKKYEDIIADGISIPKSRLKLVPSNSTITADVRGVEFDDQALILVSNYANEGKVTISYNDETWKKKGGIYTILDNGSEQYVKKITPGSATFKTKITKTAPVQIFVYRALK